MASTQVGIIYSAATGRARRVIIPDADGQLGNHPVGTGEILLIATATQYASSDPQSLVETATGLTPSGDRYAQIDADGNVVAAHILDFACNDNLLNIFTGYTLLAHPFAGPGWWHGTSHWYAPPSATTPRGIRHGRFGRFSRLR